MSFVSNVDHLTLREGVYNNVHGNLNNIVYNTFTGRKRHREEIGSGSLLPQESFSEPSRKRRRREESGHEIKVIREKHLKLTLEIGSGPGYFLHAGEIKGRAVIVKVFNSGPTVRERLESTVALSKGFLHPNVLRMEGVSSLASLTHFIAYENAFWKTAEGPLAAALRDDTTRSITLGFKMIAGLSSGMNHLSVQGISLSSLGVENFDIFLDVNDRFLISINPPQSMDPTGDQQPQDNITRSWSVFNALCQRVLRSANRVLYNENIERTPIIPDTPRRPPVTQKSMSSTALAPPESSVPTSSQNAPENEASILPRREYVWRTIERGQQSLAAIASRIGLDLDMQLSTSLNKLTSSDARNAHRCAGYSREEITLATTTSDSAVVFHDAPSPREICLVCREVVGVQEVFRCICGNPDPGSRPTVKCQTCKCWSHSDCVRSSNNFTCPTCVPDFTYNLPVVISDDEALERKADIFRLEANQWRLRAGITAIQKPRRLDGHLPARQFLEEAVDSLQREVNEWRARAGVPTIQEPDYTQEAETLRREANEWRLRAGITAIGELPRHLDGHLPARQFLEEAVDSLQREVNEWRARAGVFSIQEHQAEALRREANQWRMRAGVLSAPEPFGPRHFKNEANSFREEVNKWRARAGIRGVDALPEMAVQVFEDSEPRSGASSIIPSDILEPSAQNDEPTIFSGGTETLTTRVGLSDLVQPATSQPSVSLLAASRSWDYGDGKEDRGITSSSERNTKWMENQSDLTGFEPAQEFFKHYTGTERPTDGRGPLQLEDYVDNEIQLPLLSLFPSSSSGDHAGSPKKYVPSAHGGGTISPFLTHSPT